MDFRKHIAIYKETWAEARFPPIHHDLKDTQSTFTGSLMALWPRLLLPPFSLLLLLLLPLFLLLLMSSAGLSFFYHCVINHATGSSSASNFQQFCNLKPKPVVFLIFMRNYMCFSGETTDAHYIFLLFYNLFDHDKKRELEDKCRSTFR